MANGDEDEFKDLDFKGALLKSIARLPETALRSGGHPAAKYLHPMARQLRRGAEAESSAAEPKKRVMEERERKEADDKRKQNVRVLRPQGTGATGPSVGDILEGTGKFVTETVPEAGKAVGTATVEAFQPSVVPTGPVVDFESTVRELTEGKEDGETYEEIETDLIRSTAGGRPEDDSDDFAPKPKFFGPMGRSVTGPASDIAPYQQEGKEAARLKAFGPPRERKQSFSPERQEAARLKAYGDLAFDSDGDGKLSVSEREDARAFERQELLRGYKESKERHDAKRAEIEARMAHKANPFGLVPAASTLAAAKKALDKKTTGEPDADPPEKEKTPRQLARESIKGLPLGGLRLQDFANEDSFIEAVKRKNDPSRSAALGAGSSLRRAPVELGTRSGALRRAARAARRSGAAGQANQLFGAAAAAGMNEPGVTTQEQRGRILAKQAEAADVASRRDKLESDAIDAAQDIINRRKKQNQSPTAPNY
tara:strand:+ start:4591 stop:6039 length:1449 start_codon:yes stop_codon:yes gene_type:complete